MNTNTHQLTDTQIFRGKNEIASWQILFTLKWLIAQPDTNTGSITEIIFFLKGEQFLSNVSSILHMNILFLYSRHGSLAVF